MPILVDQARSVAANTLVPGIFAGQLHEYLPYNALLQVYSRAAAVGVFATLNLGGEVVANAQAIISVKATSVVRPDDLFLTHPGPARARVIWDLRNSTGAAIVVDTLIDITPV